VCVISVVVDTARLLLGSLGDVEVVQMQEDSSKRTVDERLYTQYQETRWVSKKTRKLYCEMCPPK